MLRMEEDLFVDFVRLKLDEQLAILTALGDQPANARPALAGANTPYQIVTHCLGVMRFWSSTVNRGIEVSRDRPGEFTASGSVAELVTRAHEVMDAFAADVRAVDLDAPPAAPRPGSEGRVFIGTCRGVLLHVFEELCQHLGQLQLTRDLLT